MPAGCEFTCTNTECENYDTGFQIRGPWPLGRIGLVIEDSKVKDHKAFRETLLQLKKDGRKYACINYPNDDEIPVVGYRIQKWCTSCHVIWDFDALINGDDHSVENAIASSDIPCNCQICRGFLMDFDDVLKNNIKCPSCNVELKQSRWFSKE